MATKKTVARAQGTRWYRGVFSHPLKGRRTSRGRVKITAVKAPAKQYRQMFLCLGSNIGGIPA